jgi:hypothetical protein
MRYVDPNGYEPIPANQLALLNSYFQQDFSNVNLNAGVYGAYVAFSFGNAWAVTFGNQVFLSSDAYDEIMSGSAKAIAGLGHELVHVDSYAALGGVPPFLRAYGSEGAIRLLQGGPRNLAGRMGMERIAYDEEPRIEQFITQSYTGFSTEICTETGDCASSPTTWYPDPPNIFMSIGAHGIPSALTANPYDAFLAGAVCIEHICI